MFRINTHLSEECDGVSRGCVALTTLSGYHSTSTRWEGRGLAAGLDSQPPPSCPFLLVFSVSEFFPLPRSNFLKLFWILLCLPYSTFNASANPLGFSLKMHWKSPLPLLLPWSKPHHGHLPLFPKPAPPLAPHGLFPTQQPHLPGQSPGHIVFSLYPKPFMWSAAHSLTQSKSPSPENGPQHPHSPPLCASGSRPPSQPPGPPLSSSSMPSARTAPGQVLVVLPPPFLSLGSNVTLSCQGSLPHPKHVTN